MRLFKRQCFSKIAINFVCRAVTTDGNPYSGLQNESPLPLVFGISDGSI